LQVFSKLFCFFFFKEKKKKKKKKNHRAVVDFQTFMTGELFDILGRHSILRATMDDHAVVQPNDAFREGVQAAKKRGLAGSLFSVRTRGALGGVAAVENTSYLSGLLIGSELVGIQGPVLLAASGALADLYAAAMQSLGCTNWLSLPAEEVDTAVVRGQALVLK
jgi:2-dehydro-3-deoxygalactonokinase